MTCYNNGYILMFNNMLESRKNDNEGNIIEIVKDGVGFTNEISKAKAFAELSKTKEKIESLGNEKGTLNNQLIFKARKQESKKVVFLLILVLLLRF